MIFKKVDKGWKYEGIALVMAREALGLNQKGLAFRCIKKNGGSWSSARISQLESPGTHFIKQKTKEILEKALKSASIGLNPQKPLTLPPEQF